LRPKACIGRGLPKAVQGLWLTVKDVRLESQRKCESIDQQLGDNYNNQKRRSDNELEKNGDCFSGRNDAGGFAGSGGR
jgi:hypothetical protein